ncbi:hypothetical protein U1Q18_012047 [Sarracenia purpurea var. burkii]
MWWCGKQVAFALEGLKILNARIGGGMVFLLKPWKCRCREFGVIILRVLLANRGSSRVVLLLNWGSTLMVMGVRVVVIYWQIRTLVEDF